MSGGLPALDRLFAGRDADSHLRAARALLSALASEFPSAGLAVTGSVARLAHRPESDLDLVVADRGFLRDAQLAAEEDGVRAAVVCLRPGLTAERELRWPMLTGGDAGIVSMIRTARVVHDPTGAFAELQETARTTDALRDERRIELAERYREEIGRQVRALNGRDGSRGAMVALAGTIADAWCLHRGVVRDRKERPLIREIEESDPELFALLSAALPVTPASIDPLRRAAARMVETLAPQSSRDGCPSL